MTATVIPAQNAWTARATRPFLILGSAAIVIGGLLSAALAPIPSYHGNWAVAYIVLVAGVAQVALGVTQTAVTESPVPPGTLLAQVLLWNLGAAATVTATILDIPVLLYAAAVAQVVALVLFLSVTRNGRRGILLALLRILSTLLLISVPTGVLLQAVAR